MSDFGARIKEIGNDRLCGLELRLWGLQQTILLRWGVFTIFKWDRLDVRVPLDGLIQWFVPDPCTYQREIVMFLEHELESEQRSKTKEYPGCDVQVDIMLFKGIEPYLERKVIEKIAEDMLHRLGLSSWKESEAIQ